jgi:drug/metabolite transporter (DMT)-like permease
LEQVFSAIFAFLYFGEILSARGYIGAILLLCSVIIAEVDFKSMMQRKAVLQLEEDIKNT